MKQENFYDPEMQLHKRNRHQAKDPKAHTAHWCDTCDAEIVSNGEKCPTCGNQDKTTKRMRG